MSKSKEILHIYRRVSTRTQEEKYSLEDQLKSGIEKSKLLKMGYKDWCEGGKSGSSEDINEREVLTELYTLIQGGEVKHLYVFDLSRLSRNPMVSSLLRKELEDNNITLYTSETTLDFKSDEEVLMYDFFSSINQFFVRVQRKKSMIGKVSHFKKGGWRGGTFPFGYKSEKIDGVKKLVINDEESKWVRKIFEWYKNDESIKFISRQLDKNNVKPRRGKFWSFGSISVILKNDLYIGTDEMVDKITNPKKPKKLYYTDKRLQIIDRKTFDLVQEKIRLTLKRKNQLTKVKHDDLLLRGLLFCGSCREMFGTRVKPSKNEYYYYCRSNENNWRKIDDSKKVECNVRKGLNIPNTDKVVWNTLVEILNNSNLIKEQLKTTLLSDKSKDDVENDIKIGDLNKKRKYLEGKVHELEDREKENRNWYLKGDITKKQYEEGNRLISETKEERFSEIEEIVTRIEGIRNSKKWINWLERHTEWISNLEGDMSIEDKKEIVKTHVRKIDVHFDKEENQHRLKIHLNLPIVDDEYRLIEKGGKGKKRVYKIINGKSHKETDVPKTKKGRKKKVDLSTENQSVKGIPPIKNTSLRWSEVMGRKL